MARQLSPADSITYGSAGRGGECDAQLHSGLPYCKEHEIVRTKKGKAYVGGVDPAVVDANMPLAKKLVKLQKEHMRKVREELGLPTARKRPRR
jgi:hypothetical protein